MVADEKNVLSSIVSSQHDFHRPYGGVVPEVAARQHIRLIGPIIQEALDDAKVSLSQISGVAVTTEPGLIGSLLVGVSTAKGLCLGCGLPLVAVNHLLAHLQSVFMSFEDVPLPHVNLLVSGGHTILFLVNAPGEASVLGSTLDDAAGEAVDKAANLLGLGYPGGPAMDSLADEGDPSAFRFPRPMARRKGYDFSFSGLKTALAVYLQKYGPPESAQHVKDIAASYLEAVVDVLVQKTLHAAHATGVDAVGVTGGVAANRRLRHRMSDACGNAGLALLIPKASYCTDNAAMVASLGAIYLDAGRNDGLHIDARASSRLPRWEVVEKTQP